MEKLSRGRPKKKDNKKSNVVVYNLQATPVAPTSGRRYNNIITLSLTKSDIVRLEKKIVEDSKPSTDRVCAENEPQPFDQMLMSCFEKALPVKEKLMNNSEFKTRRKDVERRKNLIINNGVDRKTYKVMMDERWPSETDVVCFYCCHSFDTTPVGIPHKFVNNVFNCYGNFCSYNCAKRYLCPFYNEEDDVAMILAVHDMLVGDEQNEKLQLLELLFHLETNAPFYKEIKPAPSRLVLKMFGGTKTIDEYRNSFYSHTTFHVFKMPITSVGYQIEESDRTLHYESLKKEPKGKCQGKQRLEKLYFELTGEVL